MKALWLKVTIPVASFRRPLDHNYQRTLPHPPPTTLLGLAGAALGLSDFDMWSSSSPLRGIKVSVVALNKPGLARDMWTLRKIKGNKIVELSPYFRELIFYARYILLYGGEEELLQKLKKAFMDPVYPLSLGREDELLLLEDMGISEILNGKAVFSGTILPGELKRLNFKWIPVPGREVEPPVVENLPLGFNVDKKGVRSPLNIQPFTFLPYGVEIETKDIEAFTAPLLEGRNFTWMPGIF
ncbi:CRISPR-associated protein Cas5 [Caldanaerobacter subterraneus subsp. yonseiensis KB-1]|uniref:CRISPR-associated protein Cas5 n=1 Tax=Caldanaerobacter subterraneus subsp. yonseiensis KB-1 TaxID=1388761 RepID=U5CGV2_CALSX|nr:CRISPR-associated protein Cas5 [Caldanaerobacter subterraneus]ERM92165.1 CRISPR-associated protein Cas5 [Caldanaerobacter subterraneus subsp. yonseiensis KB-1]